MKRRSPRVSIRLPRARPPAVCGGEPVAAEQRARLRSRQVPVAPLALVTSDGIAQRNYAADDLAKGGDDVGDDRVLHRSERSSYVSAGRQRGVRMNQFVNVVTGDVEQTKALDESLSRTVGFTDGDIVMLRWGGVMLGSVVGSAAGVDETLAHVEAVDLQADGTVRFPS